MAGSLSLRDILTASGWWALRPATVDVATVVLAQVGAGNVDPLAQYTGYGALGLVVLGAITGQIRFKAEVTSLKSGWDEDRRRWDIKEARLQGQVDELVSTYRDQALPALLASAEALRESANQVTTMASVTRRIEDAVDRANDILRRQGR